LYVPAFSDFGLYKACSYFAEKHRVGNETDDLRCLKESVDINVCKTQCTESCPSLAFEGALSAHLDHLGKDKGIHVGLKTILMLWLKAGFMFSRREREMEPSG